MFNHKQRLARDLYNNGFWSVQLSQVLLNKLFSVRETFDKIPVTEFSDVRNWIVRIQ
jgi:hypothetical protein